MGQPLLIAFLMVAAAARCASEDLTSSQNFSDPASATVMPGEVLATVHWNGVTQSLIGKNLPSQNHAWRMLAYVTLAQHMAVEDAATRPRANRPAMRGAIAGASAPILTHFFPNDSALIDSTVRAEENALHSELRAQFRRAESAGRAIGARVVARAAGDGTSVVWTGTVPVGAGLWSSLNVPPTPPLLPLGGKVTPFFLRSGNQFRPAAPPAWNSPAFINALTEVRSISDTRTAYQDSIAKFWAIPTGGLIVGHWNTTAIGLISQARLGERAAAHALALMNTAGQDALIACHDAKYVYWLIRPSGADPAITVSVGVPNHPSFPSNHACISGASAHILGKLFPAARERMQAKANEAAMSRLYGGIHYRFDADAGLEIARRVGGLALDVDRIKGLANVIP